MRIRFYLLYFIIFVFLIASHLLQAQLELSSLLPPESSLKGWEIREAPDVYGPETLYEYINGEAELYHRYGFVELITQTYYRSGSEDSSITVNLYHMGSHETAFGIYASYRYPEYQYEKVGAEAIISEYNLKFYQGHIFADISAWDSGPVYENGMRSIASAVSQRIGGGTNAPKITTLLPREHQIEKTLKYHPREMLNQSFLGAGVEADYEIDDDRGTGFVIFCKSDSLARASVVKLQTFYQNMGDSFVDGKPSDTLVKLKNNQDEILILNQQRAFILGSRGFKKLKTGELVAQKIAEGLGD